MAEILERILYAEDEPDVAEVTIMTLEALGGFIVKHCSNGREVLERVSSFRPQLIVLDVMMPEMSGVEALKALKAAPETKAIPVIFLTAKSQRHEQQEYLDMGAIGVIIKPYDPPTLCSALNGMWENSHG